VTLVDTHGKRSMAASDPLVERADALQYQFDSGPCLTAWRDQVTVRVDDIEGTPGGSNGRLRSLSWTCGRCSASQASQRSNTKLTEVVRRVIASAISRNPSRSGT
jgi:hypothetical protein